MDGFRQAASSVTFATGPGAPVTRSTPVWSNRSWVASCACSCGLVTVEEGVDDSKKFLLLFKFDQVPGAGEDD